MASKLPNVDEFEKVGSGYIRHQTKEAVDTLGQEVYIGGKGFPPFVVPTQYWINCHVIGTGVGVAPLSSIDYGIRGAVAEVPRDVDTTSLGLTGSQSVASWLNPYRDATDWVDPNEESDVGLSGEMRSFTDWYKDREFFRRRGRLGLPDKAVFNTDNLILYTDQWRSKGMIRAPMLIDSPKFCAFAMNADTPTYVTDWGQIIWGDEDDLPTLTSSVLSQFMEGDRSDIVAGEFEPVQNFLEWSTTGFGNAIIDDTDQQLAVRTRITFKYDVYVPKEQVAGFRVFTPAS